jgi:hypothetical protein
MSERHDGRPWPLPAPGAVPSGRSRSSYRDDEVTREMSESGEHIVRQIADEFCVTRRTV